VLRIQDDRNEQEIAEVRLQQRGETTTKREDEEEDKTRVVPFLPFCFFVILALFSLFLFLVLSTFACTAWKAKACKQGKSILY